MVQTSSPGMLTFSFAHNHPSAFSNVLAGKNERQTCSWEHRAPSSDLTLFPSKYFCIQPFTSTLSFICTTCFATHPHHDKMCVCCTRTIFFAIRPENSWLFCATLFSTHFFNNWGSRQSCNILGLSRKKMWIDVSTGFLQAVKCQL